MNTHIHLCFPFTSKQIVLLLSIAIVLSFLLFTCTWCNISKKYLIICLAFLCASHEFVNDMNWVWQRQVQKLHLFRLILYILWGFVNTCIHNDSWMWLSLIHNIRHPIVQLARSGWAIPFPGIPGNRRLWFLSPNFENRLFSLPCHFQIDFFKI